MVREFDTACVTATTEFFRFWGGLRTVTVRPHTVFASSHTYRASVSWMDRSQKETSCTNGDKMHGSTMNLPSFGQRVRRNFFCFFFLHNLPRPVRGWGADHTCVHVCVNVCGRVYRSLPSTPTGQRDGGGSTGLHEAHAREFRESIHDHALLGLLWCKRHANSICIWQRYAVLLSEPHWRHGNKPPSA